MTTARAIWQAAGSPLMPGAHEGNCRTCGQRAVGVPFDDWVRPTFTDWDKIQPGEIICHACLFVFEDRNEALDARIGKPRQRMRNYSHFVHHGQWYPLSKGEKRKMLALLPDAEIAIIAESGQKHIVFRARPGWWQFEEQAMMPDAARLFDLVERIVRMLTVFSKAEIESARYLSARIAEYGIHRWRTDEAVLLQYRGCLLFALALYLAQKEEDGSQDGSRDDSGEATIPLLEGNRQRVQTSLFNDDLESV